MVHCGAKTNQIRCLAQRGAQVEVVPWNTPLVEEKVIFFLFN